MKNTDNLVVLDTRRMRRNKSSSSACDADILMDIEAKIRQLQNNDAKRALLTCWSEQAMQVGFKGMGLKELGF